MTTTELYKIFQASSGVNTDTRKIEQENLFFALKGENFDANRFAQKALQNGASYAVIDNPKFADYRCILVEDTLVALQDLARYHRQQLRIPVIGLTGSNGKTTSKELMAAVLAKKYHTAFTTGNLNNHIGVPLSILSITPEHEMAIIEMGANHQREIDFLCSISMPDYGYITNFGKAHLEGFGGVEGVIKGKSELYNFLRASTNTQVILNLDDPIQVEKSKGIPAISFGGDESAQVRVKLIDDGRERVAVSYNNLEVQSQLTGSYNYANLAAAICVGHHFGVPDKSIKEAIEDYTPKNNRSQLAETDRNKLVQDWYNANPSSVEAALKNFAGFNAPAKWVILGDMFEMGDWSAEEHRRIADLALKLNFEKLLLTGSHFAQCSVPESVLQFETTEDLTQHLNEVKPSGKTILIKGSRGMQLEKTLPFL